MLAKGWKPTFLSGCRLWLDASVGVTLISSKVSNWADQSGYGNDVSQAVAGDRPVVTASAINGLPGIRNTVSTSLARATSPVAAGSDRTMFAVVRGAANGGDSGGVIAMFKNSVPDYNVWYFYFLGGATYCWGGNSAADTLVSPPTVLNTNNIVELVTQVGGSPVFKANGTPYTVSGFSVNSDSGIDAFSIGNLTSGLGTQGFVGDICEALIFNRVLSTVEATAVRQYLKNRYAI